MDSVVIYLNGYKLSMQNVHPRDSCLVIVNRSMIKHNGHHTMIRAHAYSKINGLLKNGMDYNDLSGSFNDSYKITLNKAKTIGIRTRDSY